MIDWLIRTLIRLSLWRFDSPRVITGRAGGLADVPYLTRYYLLGGPRTEGMDPDPDAPRERKKWFGLYLHRFHRSDDATELHNHPWKWAISLVLKAGYVEFRKQEFAGDPWIQYREVRPGALNWLTDRDFHRVELDRGDAWTLFLTGPRVQDWGFLALPSMKYTDWRTFCGLKARDPEGLKKRPA